jgi:hypothetical protein
MVRVTLIGIPTEHPLTLGSGPSGPFLGLMIGVNSLSASLPRKDVVIGGD